MTQDKGPPAHLVFNFMENMALPNFCLVSLDEKGEPFVVYRSTSPAGSRAVRGFMEDWLDDERECSRNELFGNRAEEK